MAAETGIPSVLAFMLIVFIFLKNSYWVYRHTTDRFFKATALGVLGGIFGLLLANMFGSRLDSLEIIRGGFLFLSDKSAFVHS